MLGWSSLAADARAATWVGRLLRLLPVTCRAAALPARGGAACLSWATDLALGLATLKPCCPALLLRQDDVAALRASAAAALQQVEEAGGGSAAGVVAQVGAGRQLVWK